MSLEDYTPAGADQRHLQLGGSEDVIPAGMYCYSRVPVPIVAGSHPIVACPYWALDPQRESQDNGYCAHLKSGDWNSEGLSLLWDQIKECGVREGIDENHADEQD